MRLLEIYRIAIAERLTAKQAGAKFNVSYTSLAKCKNRYGLPTLRNQWDFALEEQFNKLTDVQLKAYADTLNRTKHNPKYTKTEREIRVCKMMMEKRKLTIH